MRLNFTPNNTLATLCHYSWFAFQELRVETCSCDFCSLTFQPRLKASIYCRNIEVFRQVQATTRPAGHMHLNTLWGFLCCSTPTPNECTWRKKTKWVSWTEHTRSVQRQRFNSEAVLILNQVFSEHLNYPNTTSFINPSNGLNEQAPREQSFPTQPKS